MSLTVLASTAAALAVVTFVISIALCVVVWHHAKALHSGYSFNQWENALFEQWREQELDPKDDKRLAAFAALERRVATLTTTVNELVDEVYTKPEAEVPTQE